MAKCKIIHLKERTFEVSIIKLSRKWEGQTLLKWYFILKVSEYPFKQNKYTSKNIKVLWYTHFHNIYLNVLRPTFCNISNLPFSYFPNTRKFRVKVRPKTNYFSYFMSSCTDRIAVFNKFFSLIFSQPIDKQNRARDFLLFKCFLNNLLLTIFMQNTISKLVEFLQQKMNNSLLEKTRARFCAVVF